MEGSIFKKVNNAELFVLKHPVTQEFIRYDNGVWRSVNGFWSSQDGEGFSVHTWCDIGTTEYLESLYQEQKKADLVTTPNQQENDNDKVSESQNSTQI